MPSIPQLVSSSVSKSYTLGVTHGSKRSAVEVRPTMEWISTGEERLHAAGVGAKPRFMAKLSSDAESS